MFVLLFALMGAQFHRQQQQINMLRELVATHCNADLSPFPDVAVQDEARSLLDIVTRKDLDKIHNRIEKVHGRIDKVQNRFETAHGRIETVHDRIEKFHGRLEHANRRINEAHGHIKKINNKIGKK